jgi:archaeal cell division control protein 6
VGYGEEKNVDNAVAVSFSNNRSYRIKDLFDRFLTSDSIFVDRDKLSSAFIPDFLPHREKEISEIGFPLSLALKGSVPSNINILGKPGSGKSATTRLVGKQIESRAFDADKKISFVYVNCNTAGSTYSVLKKIADGISSDDEPVRFNGFPLDVVYSRFLALLDGKSLTLIVVLDEADKLQEDRVLYLLTRVNGELSKSRLSLVLISNDVFFHESLDERVKSSLGCENIVFPPYDAMQLQDILMERAKMALRPGVLDDDVIPYCAAYAAQEHGDARRALDMLRVAVDIAARSGLKKVSKRFVALAKSKIEFDHVAETVRGLPLQSKIVLYAILLRADKKERDGVAGGVSTGEVYGVYRQLCSNSGLSALTQRHVADLIGGLDSLGVINAPVVSRGRSGRSRNIKVSFSSDVLVKVLREDESLGDVCKVRIKNQSKLL